MSQFRTNYQVLMEKEKELEAKIQNMPDRARKALTAQLNSSLEYAREHGVDSAISMLETVYTYVK